MSETTGRSFALTLGDGATDTLSVASTLLGSVMLEGSTADEFETTIGVGDPTADLTISFPDSLESNTGTVVTTGNLADITKTGAVASGSLASGFGTIDIGSDITTSGTVTTAALVATANLDIGSHAFRASTLTADAQTSGRVAVYGTDGGLTATLIMV